MASAETLSAARPSPGAMSAAPGRYWSRVGGLLFAFAALIIAVSASFVAYDLHDRHRQALQVGLASADNLAHVIEVQAAQAMQAATLTMQHLRNAVRQMPRGSRVADEALHIQMKSAADVMEHVHALFILDENGVLVHDSDAFPARRADFSDRRYFTAHRDDPARGLHVGPLILGRTAGKTYIGVSMRVEKPGGGFGGVIVAALDPEYFQRLYASINVGRSGVVALFVSDGTLLARAPHLPGTVGKPAPNPDFLALVRSGKPYALFEARSGYDGVERLVSYRAIPGLPLACVVGLDREGVLAQWRTHAERELLLEIAFALTILGFTYVVVRQLRRAKVLTEAVSASEEGYRHLFHANPMPMWIRDPETQQFLDVNDAAVAAYGYTREEFLGLNSTDLIPEQDRAEWGRYLAGAPREGLLFRAGRHRKKDGGVIDVEVSSRIIDYRGARARLSLVNDVSERRRAEAALRESHYFMQKAQEVAHIGYWVSGPSQHGVRLVWSPEAHRIFGIGEQEFDGQVETFFSLVHPDDLEMVKAESAAALSGQRQYRVEHRIIRPDGAVRWVYQEADVSFDADGKPLEMFGVTQDITGRKEDELRLRESEGRYRYMFEGNPMPMWVRDARDGRFIDVNDAAMALYGYSREEFQRLAGEDLRPESEREAWRDFMRTRELLEHTVRRWRHLTKDGRPIEVEVTSRGFSYDGQPARLALIKDVTDQARAERALRESEERYRSLIEMSPSPIVLQEGETVILANSAALQFFGAQAEEELVGSSYLGLVHPDERARVKERMAYMERTLERVPPEVRRFRRLDGRYVLGETSAACLPHEERLLGIVTIHDVTARVEAEQALRDSAQTIQQLNAELERRVNDRTAQLEATNRELEAFAYSVSHDLRAPLRSIDGFSKALLEDYAGKLDADGKDYLARVRNAAHRMSNLINDLLALSRVARSEMRDDEVDLGALAREIIAEFRRQDPARQVEVAIQPSLKARGDAELLRILLQNLLENAWKFTVRTAGAKLELGAETRDGRETFYVRDNGVGFDMAYAGNLFGAFQRLHAASDFPGTGIGLATVQRIVRRHGGEVRAEAAVGKGATFYFTLGG